MSALFSSDKSQEIPFSAQNTKDKTESAELSLHEFCDMDQLYRLLDNWSKSCGMATMIVDKNGNPLSEDFGTSEFCNVIRSCDKGQAYCMSTWKNDEFGAFECPFGFWDLAIPIVLPDGQILGKVLAGQALSISQNDETILQKTNELGLDENLIRDILSRTPRKTEKEMQGAFNLLTETLQFFIRNSFSVWKAKSELKKTPEKKDIILSQITQIMYGYNLTIDLETEKYTLITGTGMERTVSEYKKHTDFKELREFHESVLHPAYLNRFVELTNFESLRNIPLKDGYRGSLEYPVLYPGDFEYEWHEINVFVNTEENGTRIANILGRDITKAHNAQEKNENELRAAAAKNQILSELTKMLYSYNLTLNLRTGKYSMIVGNGMTKFMEIFNSTDDYETAYHQKIAYLDPEYMSQFAALASLESLRARKNSNGFIGNLEYGALTDLGEEWHEVNVFISTDEVGEPIANILGRDITEAHKRQEQRENQQKASMARDQLLSGITKMLYSYNLTVNLNTWKYSLITGTGLNRVTDIMRQNDDYVLIHARLLKAIALEDQEKIEGLVGIQALKKKRVATGFVDTVVCHVPIDGVDEWHEVNLFISTDEAGEPVANILGRDVTEAHEAQERRENELKAVAAKDQILSNITKTLYSYNLTLNLESGKYSLIVGTGMSDFVEIFKSTDDYEIAYNQKLKYVSDEFLESFGRFSSLEALRSRQNETGYIGNLEYSVEVERGVEWHEINIFLGTDEKGNPIANILGRDITEAHEEADTKAQLEIANAANAAKSAFLFNMSHDIRTPMNAIIGFRDLLEKHQDNPEKRADYLRKIEDASSVLLSIINNVLEMARIEKGTLEIDETAWSAEQFNDTLYSVFNEMMMEKDIEFTRQVVVKNNFVFCDPIKLREVFLNILSNSYKYTNPGGKVNMHLEELPYDREGYVLYQTTISDTGICMSEEFLPHIFEEFSRENNSTDNKIEGTGLGMPIVKRLVEFLDGTIEVKSKKGVGTTVIVTLPHKIADKSKLITRPAVEIDSNLFQGKRILLVEDNDLNAEIAIEILREFGFVVERAEDGQICLEMLMQAPAGYYGLVLMDIQMPNMNGYEATREIRKMKDSEKATIPILAMTANAFEEDKREAFRSGMNGHLAKPIDVRELMRELAALLG